jgi:type I restriction enzyme S subunit
MKEGWEIKKLGEVCELMNGFAFESKQYTDEGYFVIRIGNVQDGYIELNNPRFINLKQEKQKKFILKSGDILVSLTGNVGRVGTIQEDHLPAVLNQRVAKITIKEENQPNKKFLLYFLSSEFFISALVKAGRGAAQQNISLTDIENLEIPLPPLPEQQRIVAILDEAFAAIAKAKANAEQNLKNARELFESYLQGVFENKGEGWEEKPLGEIASFSQGIQVGLEQHLTEPKPGYIRFIRIVDYTQNTDDIRYVPDPGEKYFVKEDDIIMVRYGTPGLIGRGKAGVIANNLFKITIETKELSKDFLCLCLSQKHIQTYLSTQGSATMPALNFGQLKVVSISYPTLTAQQTIVQKLEALSAETKKLEAIYQQKINDLEELKKSILQKAFSGELSKPLTFTDQIITV